MGASLIPGTCFNSCGCFLPDLTRLATLQCGEARRSLFYLISRPDEAVKRENKFGLVIANKLRYNAAPLPGEVDEWFKSPPWKGGTGATLSRVRIPPSPPLIQQSSACKGAFLFFVLLMFCPDQFISKKRHCRSRVLASLLLIPASFLYVPKAWQKRG